MASKTFYSRLVQFIAFLGVSQRDFAKECDFSSGYLNSLKNGTVPGTGILIKILDKYPQLNRDWLLSGTGEMISVPVTMKEPEVNYVFYLLAIRY